MPGLRPGAPALGMADMAVFVSFGYEGEQVRLLALSASSGRTLWSQRLRSPAYKVTVGDGMRLFFIAYAHGGLHARDASTRAVA